MLVAGMISSDGRKNELGCLKIKVNFFNFFLEPGYYEDGSFGIRLETDIETVVMNTPVN